MLSGLGFMLVYDLPIISINNLFSNIELQTSILTMLAPFAVGGLVCGGYAIKRAKDNIHAFKNINKEIEKHKLDEIGKDNDTESYDLKLEKLISDTCNIRIKLEEEKQKFIIQRSLETKKETIEDNSKLSNSIVLENVEDYESLTSSSTTKEVEGPKLVKTRHFKTDKYNNLL